MSMLLSYFKENPPGIILGSLEFCLGGVVFYTMFHKSIKFVTTVNEYRSKKLSHSDIVSLSCKLVSALFAITSCVIGCLILRDCGCISIHKKHQAVKHYMSFGLPYFFYDIYAMYIVYREGIHQRHKENNEKQSSDIQLLIPFIRSRFLLVAHHLLLPLLIYPVFMGGLQSFGGGDCLVAAGFLLEASTPFVSLRKILAILDLKQSRIYVLNGAIMTIVFFLCRVAFFPFVYYTYSREHEATIWETMTVHVPFICSISMLFLFLPQIYWFGIMVRGGLKVLAGENVKED